MARVFLDTNYFIDAIHRKPETKILDSLKDHIVCASPLSFHIYCYIFKIKIPNKLASAQVKKFLLVDFSENILVKAASGPTKDFEDNVQLHSSAEGECDLLLTTDRKLLNLKFFGKAKIIQSLER
ncbi:MAG: hypothetical protein A3D24_04830 [Candidatus Blackburnbacteria bacterium RIFCSPHIGHO2_02_FULL_39_13]|uniref:PIN domain-containing protein n=1 Tax=Candidatus Blackburnbacteria bacterium RIFCSPLOWO2_01_FULL_40_20 TaxID=1797519 RepID=A0A1G1VBC1_9BACT|nr:MAG: hypothetical protein UT38_C0007G0037 [Microgenomates group bacterium GW2011_GWA2_39_19]OGY07113.1 MAG: hypothetical protein A2694_03500 [Candidatus Blackburnbacteria bacterium RIFCSPHIGHO2_01_FULL_40_17]OGY08935.1 MAG: hypothetical protein A3D24_04830 [Candidatus Blackburnbacteria bacterium RIFCSPHIGHO2_02_FULL_39_13]OGY12719.1 MAG: hypothetical protein A3A77_00315 [Candidatus Blackburnbacteria bacterium RIFCSPLOWO2_01_FULL_40_20]OGY15299.1 MAG: hypothetical protein A3I52_01180 [Candida